ncbi:sulfurtransferase complex subunit TusB [Marinobacter koreensis]|uniref:Sulfurtransferase complex subunit TusB n=1 Tax=Marinobacter koreensis TaxID=335974 RepID=A0ABW0RH15_9GAMM|nr:sulfurtransferase complex subunit TusB [Marinobacter koreensis]MCK7548498.1 sulfurtransferase complex subunit TusB [Marinobacter koreensis]
MASIRTLHILNKTPDHPRFNRCLASLGSEDALLLTEDGVLAAASDRFTGFAGPVYALRADLEARAVEVAGGTLSPVDFEGMVKLTTEAEQIISW